MKKLFYMLCVALTVLFAGCQNNGGDEIVFDHELPLFELKEGAILLEVLMPAGTKQEEELYIVGEFNGGEEQALGNMMWQLEPSSNIKKWGIYLYPETFVEGKSLADGYYFYSKQQGKERTVKNEDILHYETAEPGQRVNNIMVSRWEKFFLVNGDTVEHDGYVAYVIDETSWGGDLAMYAWGDAEAFGGWPGKLPDGQEVINDVMYTYFDLGEANTGLNLNLIFNNNGGGEQLADYNITVSEDIFIRLTDDGVESLAEPLPTTDGYALFVDNQAGWAALALYVWGGTLGDNGIGNWPGMQPTATCKYKGVEYTYFDLGAGNNGKDGNFIINDNGAGNQTADIAWTLDKNLFVRIYADKSYVEIDPENPSATVEPEPEPEPDPSLQVAHKIYVNNQTSVENLYVYAYGDAEIFGGWAGQQLSGNETIDGVDYVWVETAAEYGGKNVNLIFSDGVGGDTGWQINGPYVALTKDYYFTVTDDAVTEVGGTVEPAPTDGVWGIAGEFNGWSATECVALTEGADGWWSIEGQELAAGGFKFVRDNGWNVNYGLATGVVFALDTELSLAQGGENLVVEAAGKYNISLNPESALCKVTLVGTVEPTPTPDAGYSVYVDDQTGWDAIAAHVYIEGGYATPWPGILPEAEPVEKDGVSYKQFITSSEVKDQAVNIIFNDNNGGTQLAEYYVTLDKDIYLKVTVAEITPVGGTVEPEPEPEEAVHKIYVYNKSSHNPLYVYAYGDAEVFGGWAGQAQKGTETINGVEYAYFEVFASGADKKVNLIFSDGVGGDTGWQINGPTNVTLNKDYYYRVNDDVCVEISTDAPDADVDIVSTYSIYVKNGSGWNPLYLYSWGDGVAQDGLGSWPGMKQTEEVNIDGTTYTRFAIPDALIGSSMHLIFNNGKSGAGGQFDGPFVTFQNDLYYEITSTTCTEIVQ